MRIVWSEELGCIVLDGVPYGMPEQPTAVSPAPPAKGGARLEIRALPEPPLARGEAVSHFD
ncbi:MAG TPA: hypothetical protein VKB84_07095 [Candidatus Binataceae bacterium]|jgi:hypothetical protein|nr:hypothetical protein [Candidatus Binataceae bacterium]